MGTHHIVFTAEAQTSGIVSLTAQGDEQFIATGTQTRLTCLRAMLRQPEPTQLYARAVASLVVEIAALLESYGTFWLQRAPMREQKDFGHLLEAVRPYMSQQLDRVAAEGKTAHDARYAVAAEYGDMYFGYTWAQHQLAPAGLVAP